MKKTKKQTQTNINPSLQAEINLKNDISTLKKVQKWAESILLRIAKHSNGNSNYQCDQNKSNNQEIINQKIKKSTKISTEIALSIIKNQITNTVPNNFNDYDEDYYEQKYKRDHYDVLLHGNGISAYTNIYERIDEIKRCTGIKSPEMVRPIIEKSSKNTKLKIRVKDYLDYRSLIQTWPLDSFNTGVKADPALQKLKVIVLDVERKLKINQDNIEIKELENKYGLYNVHRVYNHKNQSCSRLIASCKKIRDYIHVLKFGIYIGNKKYAVLPNIVNYKVCSKCGSLNHQGKNCSKEKRCLKCTGYGHQVNTCKSKFSKCVNCSGSHKCYSDLCHYFAQKKFYINRFVISVLMGENIIFKTSDILQVKKDRDQNSFSDNMERHLKDKIESILSNKLTSHQSQMDNLEQTINIQSLSLHKMRESLQLVRQNVLKVESRMNITQESLNLYKAHELAINESVKQLRETSSIYNQDVQKQLIDLLRYFNPSQS